MCAKSEDSDCIRAVWSVFAASLKRIEFLATNRVPNEDSEQTAPMRSLIWVFAEHTVMLWPDSYSFLQKEPEENGMEILKALKYVRPGDGFVPNFQMFKKAEINGKNEIPLYTYLKVRNELFDVIFLFDQKRMLPPLQMFEHLLLFVSDF